MEFSYIVGRYYWKSDKAKVIGGFLDEKTAQEYCERVELDYMGNGVFFVHAADGAVTFLNQRDRLVVVLGAHRRIRLTEKETAIEKWVDFDLLTIYDAETDQYRRAKDVIWKSDFEKALKSVLS